MAKIYLSLIAIASLAGIFAVASASSVPGTILYPFKVDVCEPLGRLLAMNGAQGNYATDMADQRLIELQILTENNTATSDRQQELLDAFDAETKNVQGSITVFIADEQLDKATALAKKFQTMVATHIAVFTALQSPVVPHLQNTLDTIQGSITLSTTTPH